MIFAAGLCGVEFADGVAGLGIGGGGYGAGVDDDDVGGGGTRGEVVALGAELALDGGGVGLCSTTTELFNVEGRHGSSTYDSGYTEGVKDSSRTWSQQQECWKDRCRFYRSRKGRVHLRSI